MTSNGHLTFSLATIIFVKKLELLLVLNQGQWGHVIIGAMLTCLLPDLDHPKSFLGKKIKWLSILIYKNCGHRGITHSLFFIFIFNFILSSRLFLNETIPRDFVAAMTIGYLSHILADMFTPAGVLLFWPFKLKFCIPIINYKKRPNFEKMFCILILMFSFIFQIDELNYYILYIYKTIIKLFYIINNFIKINF